MPGCREVIMRLFTPGLLISLFLTFATANALTVDEIVKLKQAGTSDETIQMLIERDYDRPSGTWKTKDGWIVHSTEIRGRRLNLDSTYQDPYTFVGGGGQSSFYGDGGSPSSWNRKKLPLPRKRVPRLPLPHKPAPKWSMK